MGKPISFEGATIEVPNDATDAEIATILSSYPRRGFATLPSGAAVPQPKTPARPLGPTGTDLITDIGGAGVIGAGMGVVAPEILQGVGGAARSSGIPQLQGVGSGIEFLGRAARAAGPAARVASGFLSGVGSETLGKTAEGLGAGPVTAEVARLVGGGLTPEFVRIAGTLTANVLSHWAMPGRIDAAAMRTIAGNISRKIRQTTGQPLSEYEQAYVDKLIADVHGSQKPGEALGAVGSKMLAGAETELESGAARAANIVAIAESDSAFNLARGAQIADQRLVTAQAKAAKLHTEATTTLNDAEIAARAELAAAENKIVPYGQATNYLTTLKNQTTKAAQQTRAAIGTERPGGNTDIGVELRDVATKRESDFRKNAKTQYDDTAGLVNTGVAKLETEGKNVASLKEYKDLVSYLEKEIPKRSPTVAAGLKKLLAEITVKVEEGAPAVSPKFIAIDDARRLMGEAFRGQPVEGFNAIDKIERKNLYSKLRDIQVKFAGDKQAQLLEDYADSRVGLEDFGSKAGKYLTGLDRGALTQFANDPAKMPGYFFKTPTSFQHLVDLVGDKALATQAGLDHITAELASKDTSAKVRSWMTANREMLNAVPGAKLNVDKYATALEAAEKSNAKLDVGIARLDTRQANIRSNAASQATDIRSGGAVQRNALAAQAEKVTTAAEAESNALIKQVSDEAKTLTAKAGTEASVITKESQAAADKIWNRANASPELNARNLIENGDATQWALVAPIIQRSPEGKRNVYDALRQTLADKLSSGSTKGITQWFNETVSPAMVKTEMLDVSSVQNLAKQLAIIEAQRVPPAEELGRWNRMLLQAISGYSSSLGSRGARAGFSLVPDIPTNSPKKNNLAPAPQNALSP